MEITPELLLKYKSLSKHSQEKADNSLYNNQSALISIDCVRKSCMQFFCHITLIFFFSISLQCLFSGHLKCWQVVISHCKVTVQLEQGSGGFGRRGLGKGEDILLGLVHPLQSGGSGPAERWPGRSAGPGAGSAASHWRLTPSSGIPLQETRANSSFILCASPKLFLKPHSNQTQSLGTDHSTFLGTVGACCKAHRTPQAGRAPAEKKNHLLGSKSQILQLEKSHQNKTPQVS